MMLRKGDIGIDASKWQGDIDFLKLKEANLKFALLRSSFRQTIDPKFLEYVAGLRSISVPVAGVYHFSYALSAADAIKEAQFCVASVNKAGLKPGECVLFYDFEYDTVDQAKKAGVTLTPTLCNQFTKAFCDEVQRMGYEPGVYFNGDYYLNWYDKGLLASYIRWIADWRAAPKVYDSHIHQYSNKGKLPGINADVDMNIVLQDLDVGSEVSEPILPERPVLDTSLQHGWLYREFQNGSKTLFKELCIAIELNLVAKQVLAGMWDNGDKRVEKLESAGYSAKQIQELVNKLVV